jgi:hypothetical protein
VITPDAVRYYVWQEPELKLTCIRMVLASDQFDADGYRELKPGEAFLGQVASTLREGCYTGDGIFLHGLD